MIPHSLGVLVGLAVWALAIAGALIRGRAPERIVAIALAAELLLSFLSWGSHINGRRWPTFVGDAFTSGVLVLTGVRTRRRWAARAAPLQLLSTATLASKMVDPGIGGFAYLFIEQVLGFGVVGLLVWGVFWEARAVDRNELG